MSRFSWAARLRSVRYALAGGRIMLATQHNAWIHAAATIAVVVLGVSLPLSRLDWALLIVAIALVWIAEALNTGLEFLADSISTEPHQAIGRAKDVAAFAVLLAALAAVLIGGCVFMPYLLT